MFPGARSFRCWGQICKDGSIVFGFHPRAARVYLVGNFNDMAMPGHFSPREDQFLEMELYRGFRGEANIWLTRLKPAKKLERIEYKFFLQGGSTELERYVVDPYTRVYSDNYRYRNAELVDPTRFIWSDHNWPTPDIKDLVLYELNVYGFTDNDPRIAPEHQGTFQGSSSALSRGYFEALGVTAISLMPVAEVPNKRGLGYEPCHLWRWRKTSALPTSSEMVDTAHNHGLAVIVDQVFNHTSNDFNPCGI